MAVKLTDLEAQMCLCKSKSCAGKVRIDVSDYTRQHSSREGYRWAHDLHREIRKCDARASRESPIAERACSTSYHDFALEYWLGPPGVSRPPGLCSSA